MTALVLEAVSGAEELFAQAHLLRPPTATPGADPDEANAPGRPGASGPDGTAAASRPRARMLPAPAAASPVEAAGPAQTAPPTVQRRVAVLRVTDREPVLDCADEAPAPAPSGDVTGLACLIAQATVEVLGGRRPAAQLARWVTPGVYDAVHQRAALTVRVLGTRATTRPPVVRRVRLCAVDQHVHEASVVVDDGTRVRAVALRLEAHRGAWRATVVEVG